MKKHKDKIKIELILVKNLACCKNKITHQFGCTNRYYKNRNNKKYRLKYKYKKPRRRCYVKNYKTKRPYRLKRKLTECTCYNCEKLGHIGRDSKLSKNSKKKQIS